MPNHLIYVLIVVTIAMWMPPVFAGPEQGCGVPELSADQIHAIVVKARAAREDLAPAFREYDYTSRREGCHYIYIEYGLPHAPEYNQMFRLNRDGVIVNLQSGAQVVEFQCPGKGLAEAELAEIVRQNRVRREELPAPFSEYRVHEKVGCLYLYFEHNVPKRRGDYQVFTIDPLGELMDFSRSQPY